MHAYLLLPALGLLGCGQPPDDELPGDSDADTDADTDSDTDADLDSDLELHGERPDEALPLIAFEVTNRDGSARDESALRGHPTVLWFYPLAASSG